LEQRFGGQPVAIALEQSRGALVAMLSKYAHLVLFAIHPNTLTHYRKAFTPSGAKSDPGDADLALELLVTHPNKLRRLEPDTVEIRKLQFLTEQRRDLVNLQTSQKQTLISWLKQVFPQMLDWYDDVSTPMVGDLLLQWPTLQALQKVSSNKLRRFFTQHHCRSTERIEERITKIRGAVPATQDPALLYAGSLRIQTIVQLLAELRTAIATYDGAIAEIYRQHPDRAIMESFPGAGAALEPRLLAAVGTRRDRFETAQNLAMFAGIAPAQEASGKQKSVHWRWSCPKFIRQTFHEWAACSIRTCDWAREHYDAQRNKGKGHHAAVRSVAFKWIRIFFRCWHDRVPYCEATYLAARQARAPQSQPSTSTSQLQWKSCAGFFKLGNVSS
jgi:transposase